MILSRKQGNILFVLLAVAALTGVVSLTWRCGGGGWTRGL
jgi:hypothetical protein